ncbi:MAG TPA: hypothetical protein VE093_16545 [Polyangiaceae bacterium]|nr:hypothetical protein [Polyangiaceae bacterium]
MPPRHATTLPALRSLVDFSSLHALRARRAAREPRPAEKLALLRRLAQKTVFGNLPETRVEQSWNEQLFAKVLGYRTLLSHDARPFHILPKNAADRYHYDDFSLGFFGAGEDIVLGSAELKSPGASLDAPQTSGNYNHRTPVQQALETAHVHGPGCRWVLVSNFRELRLYDMREPSEPLAVVKDLSLLRNQDDLALVCAHFDAAALLGEPGKDNADMAVALDLDHPSHPLPPHPENARLVLRFVRKEALTLALFRVEKALREAGEAVRETLSVPAPTRDWGFVAKDGWVSTEPSSTVRLAASRFGEVQLSLRIPTPPGAVLVNDQTTTVAKLAAGKLHDGAVAFCRAITAFHRSLFGSTQPTGVVGGELREVKNTALQIESMQEPMAPIAGVCPAPDISAGDFDVYGSLASPVASCLCELAVQFRASRGGVGLSLQQLSTWLERKLENG